MTGDVAVVLHVPVVGTDLVHLGPELLEHHAGFGGHTGGESLVGFGGG